MRDRWAEQFVDGGLDRAWLDFRVDLADRIEDLRTWDDTLVWPRFRISTESGDEVVLGLKEGSFFLLHDRECHWSHNVDQLAFQAAQTLRTECGVLHPSWLIADLGAPAAVDLVDRPSPKLFVPELSSAESTEQLDAWVKATLAARAEAELVVDDDGDVPLRSPGGNGAWVRVRNAGRIELFTILARKVDVEKAHAFIDRVSPRMFGLKFFLADGCLFMSQIVIARPFVPEQLHVALQTFLRDVDRFADVSGELEQPEDDRAILLAMLQHAEERIGELEFEVQHLQDYVDILTETEAESEVIPGLERELEAAKAELAEWRLRALRSGNERKEAA